jgi:hypothetical protein
MQDAQHMNADLNFNHQNLYREESFTDMKTGSIRRLSPVDSEGNPAPGRPTLFFGYAQLMSPKGPLPIQCPIQAATLAEALEEFPKAIEKAVEKMVQQIQKAQQKESSRIVVPGM